MHSNAFDVVIQFSLDMLLTTPKEKRYHEAVRKVVKKLLIHKRTAVRRNYYKKPI